MAWPSWQDYEPIHSARRSWLIARSVAIRQGMPRGILSFQFPVEARRTAVASASRPSRCPQFNCEKLPHRIVNRAVVVVSLVIGLFCISR
jgi:hypothetical protein